MVSAPFLLGSVTIPEHSDYQLDLSTLRKLSEQTPGPRPLRINAAVVDDAMAPAAIFLGGIRFDRHRMVFPAYEVVYSNTVVVIDAPPGREFFTKAFPGTFNQKNYDAEQAALKRARAIVITHEHADHLQGIAESPALTEFASHLALSREQRDDVRWLSAAKFPESVRTALHPIDYDHYYPLAPGVVLIKAPGHTVGSHIVYVRLANNSEFLFLGDVAWDMEQVTIPKCRPRLPELFMREDSGQVAAELRTLHDFALANSSVHFVVSHDGSQLDGYQQAGLIGRSFE